jgi:hypothetical protein
LVSDCGYDHATAGHKTHQNAVDFTGCLAHVEVTYLRATQKIIRVHRYFDHNEACKTAVIARFPAVPLHPAVYEIALQQLKDSATLTDVQDRNRAMVQSVSYRGHPKDLKQSTYRWLLRSKDTRSLYRQFNRMQGIKGTEQAHINVDEWLDPKSPQYSQTLRDAIFHYSPWATREERFEVCVAIPDMREAAFYDVIPRKVFTFRVKLTISIDKVVRRMGITLRI